MIDRREFTAGLAGAAAWATLTGVDAAAATRSPSARRIFKRALVLDANTSLPVRTTTITPEWLAFIRDTGLHVIRKTVGGFNASFADTVRELAFWERVIERHSDALTQVRTIADIDRARREQKLGMLFGFEGVSMFEDDVERIRTFRNLGVRTMQLNYNLQSAFGSGVLAEGGLTELGRKAIAIMNETGVALDLSHSNETTSLEALAVTTKTPLLTHGGCAAVYEHPRNKSDRLLRAAADKGAVLGIYMLPYIAPSPKQPTVDDYIAHMSHALRVMGEDHVGIGADVGLQPTDTSPENLARYQQLFEERRKAGVGAPGEDRLIYVEGLNTWDKHSRIADALLARGYSSAVVEKVLGKNFYRALSEAWS